MKTSSLNTCAKTLRHWLARGFVLVYLGAIVFFLYCHLLGDASRFSAGYLFTWDMFPNYPSFSARRLALGKTNSGQYVLVFPTTAVKYHRGGHRDLTRFDLPRNDAALRQAASQTLKAQSASESADPVTYVFLVEKFWPVRWNLPDDLYRSAYDEENPHRHAWRILDEGTVNGDGDVNWVSVP